MNSTINLENKLHEYRLELLKIKVNEDSKRQDQILESIKKLKNKIKIDKQEEEEELDKIPNITRNKCHIKSNIKGKKRQIFITNNRDKKANHARKQNKRNKVFYLPNKILYKNQTNINKSIKIYKKSFIILRTCFKTFMTFLQKLFIR
jgi:hypothetical protein